MSNGFTNLAFWWLRMGGGLLSHRSRSSIILVHNNKNYLFCTRCSGVYTTAIVGLISFTFFTERGLLPDGPIILLTWLFALPAIVDLSLLNLSDRWRHSHFNRKFISFTTGSFFGISIALLGPLQVDLLSKVIATVAVFLGLFLFYKIHLWSPYG